MAFTTPSNEAKAAVWKAYYERKPTRVPLRWSMNSRILLLNPELNPDGIGYREYFHDPQVTLSVQARFQEYVTTVMNRTCDAPVGLPEAWSFSVESQNVYDAAYFGAEVLFEPGQVPGTHQFLGLDDVDAFMRRDFSRPLENPWIRERLAFHAALTKAAESFTYLGRKGKVAPYGVGFDGPLTIAANLLGSDIFLLLAAEPEKAKALMFFLCQACAARNRALGDLAGGWKKSEWSGMADDSIQLISTEMYEELVLPAHAWWYDEMTVATAAEGRRAIHLCGDSTRHFRTIRDRLGVTSFDTGYPVDHGWLRRELGPGVEVSGGPQVAILRHGTVEECRARATEILASGIKQGGRFILQEGNNLPPCVPLENLEAVYAACLEFGGYPDRSA